MHVIVCICACEFRDEILLRGEECKTRVNLSFSKNIGRHNIIIFLIGGCYSRFIIKIIIGCLIWDLISLYSCLRLSLWHYWCVRGLGMALYFLKGIGFC